MALQRGNVVAIRRDAIGLVWSFSSAFVWIAPVGGYNGPPPHRAEVRVTDLAEIYACGVSLTFPVVRCHQMYQAPRNIVDAAPLLGTAPALLIGRIESAILREARARVTERNFYASRAHIQAIAARHD